MKFHSQNLNEKKNRTTGSMARHGRCWIDALSMSWNIEWRLFGRGHSGWGVEIGLARGENGGISGNLCMGWLFGFYWGVNARWLRWLDRVTSREDKPRHYGPCGNCGKQEQSHELLGGVRFCDPEGLRIYRGANHYWPTNGRTIGVKLFEDYLWIDLWNDPMESHHGPDGDPRWWHISMNLPDLFLGRATYAENPIETRAVTVPMPEGGYRGTATLSEDTWTRPRWFTKRVMRVNIKMDEPIPFPGKGESEWDCGEDSMHGMTTAATNILDGVLAASHSVLNDRLRYGSGYEWRPEKARVA